MFLIASIVAAGVLLNAVFPVIYTMTGTFGQSSHEADQRIRTDIKIINTYARSGIGQVWMKNIGTNRISYNEINMSDVFVGAPGDFESVPRKVGSLGGNGWSYQVLEDTNTYWEPGETMHLTMESSKIPTSKGDIVYFQYVSVNGVVRATEFPASG
ncbi:MAG: flagellin [Methanomicrobiales archaeon]|nr:flagellin [Methanomicrobiales archaeon]